MSAEKPYGMGGLGEVGIRKTRPPSGKMGPTNQDGPEGALTPRGLPIRHFGRGDRPMAIIMPPTTPLQVLDPLGHLDFQPPCEYLYWLDPACNQPAAWAIWVVPHCDNVPSLRYFCDDCWGARRTGHVQCKKCYTSWPSMQNVLRVVHL